MHSKLYHISANGGWSNWSDWSGCAPGVCAGNQRIRTRTCSNPIPSDDGAYCVGDNAEQKDCMSEYLVFGQKAVNLKPYSIL